MISMTPFMKIFLLILIVSVASVSVTCAQMMSSTHYHMQSDSINFAGNHSTSTSYTLEDTAGEIATGYSSSTNYVLGAGYQQMGVVAISVVPPTNVTLSPV